MVAPTRVRIRGQLDRTKKDARLHAVAPHGRSQSCGEFAAELLVVAPTLRTRDLGLLVPKRLLSCLLVTRKGGMTTRL